MTIYFTDGKLIGVKMSNKYYNGGIPRVKLLITDLGWESNNLSDNGKKALRELNTYFNIKDYDYTKNIRRVSNVSK
tara:strand:- start:1387 stop:1614 length:228 start_codon:yes stop_codon:yes gene_type:complete